MWFAMMLMAALLIYWVFVMPYQLDEPRRVSVRSHALTYGYVFAMSFFAAVAAVAYGFHRRTTWRWYLVGAWLSIATISGALYWYLFFFGSSDQEVPSGWGKVTLLVTSICVPIVWRALWLARPSRFQRSRGGVPWTVVLSERELSFLRDRVAKVLEANLAPEVRGVYRKTEQQLQRQNMTPEAVSTLIGSLQAIIQVAVEDGAKDDKELDRARSILAKLESVRTVL